ncbi:MAG: 1,4-dihydroxy-2-naphthoate octaprenyltransferase [Paludibacteraceae bacterium]|nr:1,4-dihydroxy-2-naphthoate octaprenyltransferase [Paludibacteraceae bacterium]
MSPFIQSLRPRTLPLSMSGIILGSGLAYLSGFHFQFSVFILAILTTLSLQILSNLSNELGDALKGTDADQHGRTAYGLQTGAITIPQMKRMIILFIVLSVLFGSTLVFTAFWTQSTLNSPLSPLTNTLIFLAFGALAIIGAMTYTLGKHSYGYIGLGDLGVFLFFGLLSTLGAFYLQTQTLTWEVTSCGIAIGLPCVGVLNLNNIRDMANDRLHGKHTFASLLGPLGARVYHALLLVACLALFAACGHLWTLLILPVWIWHVWFICQHPENELDKQMPVLMFTTIIVACLAIL